MEQIRLDNQLPVKKTDHTSKGDQLKWKIGNIWYKSDYMGYEGLSETLVSHLLQKSTLSHPFVLYQPVRIACGSLEYSVLASTNSGHCLNFNSIFFDSL